MGDASARPAGLERALTRAGFQLVERGEPISQAPPDAILVTLADINGARLEDLLPSPNSNITPPPRIVILSTGDPDAPATALGQGAEDALGAPIHFPELCARLHARIRERRESGSTATPVMEPIATEDAALERRIQEELERARRYSLSFSLVLLSADELEFLTEQQGDAAAARRREDIGGVLRRELRLPDYVTEYGAGEFAIVLPETDGTGARQSVIRIRDRLAAVPFDGDPRSEQPRFSAGIVTYPHPAAAQKDDLFDLAEAALMRGKQQSGERIGVAM
ncbi:MAG: diguanylate cyclase domain-containing protein [Gemmatimonadales bacterium]